MIKTRISRSKYLKVSEGFIVDTEGNKLGNMIGGFIKKIEITTVKGADVTLEVIQLQIAYEDESYQINLPLDTTGRGFMLMIPNIDYRNIIEIHTAKNEAGYSYIWATQDGKTIKNFWTNEDPKDKPQWEKTEYGKWDKSKELAYLKNITNRYSQDLDNYLSFIN